MSTDQSPDTTATPSSGYQDPNSNRLKQQLRKLADSLHEARNSERENLLGKILTIVDASIADPQQRKATKDLVRNAFWGDASPFTPSVIGLSLSQLAEANGFALWPEESLENAPHTPATPINPYAL